MMPRAGGEADKVGNRFELRWTVRQVLRVLRDDADSITVEPIGEIAEGVEFALNCGSTVEVHQVKRQNGTDNGWTVGDLRGRRVWDAAKQHVGEGRKFHFVSTVPSTLANTLCYRAAQSTSLEQFLREQLTNDDLKSAFTTLAAPGLLGSPPVAWVVLRGASFTSHNEDDIVSLNVADAGALFGGMDGRLAVSALGELVLDHLGVQLTRADIEALLPEYGLVLTTAAQARLAHDTVEGLTAKWLAEVRSQLLQPAIPRDETTALRSAIASDEERVFFIIGSAGGGKSVVLHDFVTATQAAGDAVLAFRLDRLPDFWSTQDIGEQLELGTSPVAALKLAMGGTKRGVLVIDQLDAVSLQSGRTSSNFTAVAELIQEAEAFDDMRVVVACRKFDLEADYRIRALSARPDAATIAVGPLTDEQLNAAITAMGLDATRLTPHQREILRAPLQLLLLHSIAGEADPLGFQTSTHLFAEFWDRKRRAAEQGRSGVRFAKVLTTLAQRMSEYQRLAVPRSVLDEDELDADADVLESEHVLIRDGANIAFFHEAFFDYVFSRGWIARPENLVGFLLNGEQELFRRAQVRQILTALRDSDPNRFVAELRSLLEDERIRFHIKAAAISVVRAVPDPTTVECRMLVEVADRQSTLRGRLDALFRNPVWFARLDTDGYIESWLGGNAETQERALTVMTGAGDDQGDRLAALLQGHRHRPEYERWARWVLQYAEVNTNRALFDLLLDAVVSGFYAENPRVLWMSVWRLSDAHPEWAVELLRAYFIDQPGALDLNDKHEVARLNTDDYQVRELVQKASAADPKTFSEVFLPYMRQVVAATEMEPRTERPIADRHFHFRYRDSVGRTNGDDLILEALSQALRRYASEDPESARALLDILVTDPHDTAQFLLYEAILGNPSAYAEWAASLLLEGSTRWLCGYVDDLVWKAREVLEAISPHVSDETFAALEGEVRDVRFSWERRYGGGVAFKLLSALEEPRLSDLGKRRLGELRRKVRREQPEPPRGIRGGVIGSPIEPDVASHMSDEHWLRAIAKYDGDRRDWDSFRGGAHELSSVLLAEVKRDPARFAAFASRITPEMHHSYADAILMGLGDAPALEDPAVVFDVVRQFAAFGSDENDRWIGNALRPYREIVPIDIVELVRDKAVGDADPADDGVRVTSSDRTTGERVEHIYGSGINTARGSLAECLADLLLTDDAAGTRSEVVAPALLDLAGDPAVPVRACVARVIGASLLHKRAAAVDAFVQLVATEDALLSTHTVIDLIVFIGRGDFAVVRPIIERMLTSEIDKVREAGGELACFASIEWATDDLLHLVLDSDDKWARRGAAMVAATRAPRTTHTQEAVTALVAFLDDDDVDTRRSAAQVAVELRDQSLRPFSDVLIRLINSVAFTEALSQLLLALEHAKDDVDDLILLCAQRFVEVHGEDAADVRTGAAGDAREVAQLIISAYFRTALDEVAARRDLLDVLDRLLQANAFGIDEVVTESERH